MRVAVVLFNLGGPDCQQTVKPFLFNLFYDKCIIRLPNPIRYLLAKGIASRREKAAQKIYQNTGGKSLILSNTQKQAKALQKTLGNNYKTFIAMRYWHPLTQETAQAVKDYNPDTIVLLPLYPQYSTTTTKSSFLAWYDEAKKAGLNKPTKEVCCYPTFAGFVDQIISQMKDIWNGLDLSKTRFLFSAHGLPEKIIKSGDPYQFQIEQTVASVLKKLPRSLDSVICYQSRVGPLKWIGPSTEEEIKRAGVDKKDIVVIPIAFVSEHSETLVELDIEYRQLAKGVGIKNYHRLATVDTRDIFIQGLRDLVLQSVGAKQTRYQFSCPAVYCDCWQRSAHDKRLSS